MQYHARHVACCREHEGKRPEARQDYLLELVCCAPAVETVCMLDWRWDGV